MKKCLYCDKNTKDPHFQSDCCGRGMCDYCFDNLVGTMEQVQIDYMDQEDFETIKPEYKNASYLCFDCAGTWRIQINKNYKCNFCGIIRLKPFPISDESGDTYCPDCNTTLVGGDYCPECNAGINQYWSSCSNGNCDYTA